MRALAVAIPLANLAGAGLHHVRAFDVPVSTLSARAISLGADRLGDKQIQVSRVLVPLDGSELATGAIDYRVALPQANGLEHVLVEVVATIGDEKTWVEEEDRLNVAADRIRARRGARRARGSHRRLPSRILPPSPDVTVKRPVTFSRQHR